MASTRITIVLDVHHEPDVDLPLRAAVFLTPDSPSNRQDNAWIDAKSAS
ncbi:MAG: hypothetical protein QOD01_205 [Actinomycetota bacterium]|nr:hypothetical protein [Actinomycetota bacterium]